MQAQLNQQAIGQALVGLVQEITEAKEDISQSASLYEDYGLDSIDFMELFISIDHVYGIRIELQEYLNSEEEHPLSEGTSGMPETPYKEASETENDLKNHSEDKAPKMILQDLNIELLSRIILDKLAIIKAN
jgi:acyl carrier protein